MKILIPTSYIKNPYIFQLVKGLQKNKEVTIVQTLVPWLYQDDYSFDVIHLQWPESVFLTSNYNEKDISALERRLLFYKNQGARIVITVHNKVPHKGDKKKSYFLYKKVYQYCDGVIHMGESSKDIINKDHADDLESARQIIIPHGNYEYFPNSVSRKQARQYLGIPESNIVVASIGAIRSSDEYRLIKNVSKALRKRNGLLLQIGQIYSTKNRIKHLITIKSLKLQKNLRQFGSYVADSEIQYYLNACDILLVPRVNTLNSGNVALGYTFGRIVLGPDYGVIGEDLKRQGNPVFRSIDEMEVSQTLDHAIDLIHTDVGKNNKNYAIEELNWDRLTLQYLSFYKNLN